MNTYFCVDDVLSNEQETTCEFLTASFASFGEWAVALRQKATAEPLAQVEPEALAELPLWCALALRDGGFVAVHAPPMYGARMQVFRSFRADAMGPNLRQRSPYFYEVGLSTAAVMASADGTTLKKRLIETFQRRFEPILHEALVCKRDAEGELTSMERRLFRTVAHYYAERQAWKQKML